MQKKVGPPLKKRCTVGSVHEHDSVKWLNLTMTLAQAPVQCSVAPSSKKDDDCSKKDTKHKQENLNKGFLNS